MPVSRLITSPTAEPYYGIPHFIMEQFKEKFPDDIKKNNYTF